MKLLNKFSQFLPYCIVSKLINKIAPYQADIIFFGNERISVNVFRMSDTEYIVKKREVKQTKDDHLHISQNK